MWSIEARMLRNCPRVPVLSHRRDVDDPCTHHESSKELLRWRKQPRSSSRRRWRCRREGGSIGEQARRQCGSRARPGRSTNADAQQAGCRSRSTASSMAWPVRRCGAGAHICRDEATDACRSNRVRRRPQRAGRAFFRCRSCPSGTIAARTRTMHVRESRYSREAARAFVCSARRPSA